jgi:hypothetical protein
MLNKAVFIFIAILFLLVEFSACKKEDNPVQSTNSSDLFPLNVGNQWTFDFASYDSANATPNHSSFTIQVLRDTVIQYDTWFITNDGIFRNSSQGLLRWEGQPILFYHYPASVGDTTRVYNNSNVVLVSKNATKSVPFGILSCYNYHILFDTSNGFYLNNYYSIGVGFVSFELADRDTRTNALYVAGRYQLRNYLLK